MLTENYYLSINWWERIIIHHRRVKGWHFNASHLQGQQLVEVWLDQ
jgi:peptide/nickel transport system substrate-binding protein